MWPIDGTYLTGKTTPSQSGPGGNSNGWILHTFNSFGTGSSPSDAV